MSASELAATSDGTDGGTIDSEAGTSDRARGDAVDAPRTDAGGADRARGRATDATDEPMELSKDVLFDVLKNERRRRALEFLREHSTTTLSDLAEHVAALENDKSIRELTSSERKRVYVGFYQCHLPKMADAGLVDYERSRGTVALRERASPCFVYLDIDPYEGTRGRGTTGRSACEWLSRALSSLAKAVPSPLTRG